MTAQTAKTQTEAHHQETNRKREGVNGLPRMDDTVGLRFLSYKCFPFLFFCSNLSDKLIATDVNCVQAERLYAECL